MSRHLGPSEQGQLQGALTSLMALAGTWSPPMFTRVFAWAIAPERGGAIVGAPFFLSASLIAVGLVIAGLATRVPRSAAA